MRKTLIEGVRDYLIAEALGLRDYLIVNTDVITTIVKLCPAPSPQEAARGRRGAGATGAGLPARPDRVAANGINECVRGRVAGGIRTPRLPQDRA